MPRHLQGVTPEAGPYLLALATDEALARALRHGIVSAPVRVVPDLRGLRAVLQSTAPPAMLTVLLDDEAARAISAVRIARHRWPRLQASFLARRHSARLLANAAQAESDLLVIGSVLEEIVERLDARARAAVRMREAQRALADLWAGKWRLSRRQHECMRLIAYGVAQSELAGHLGVSPGAVEQL